MWAPPEGHLHLQQPISIDVWKPGGLSIPSFHKDTKLGDYAKTLDSHGNRAENQQKYQQAAYLYGLLFSLGSYLSPRGNVNVLWAQVKLASNLYWSERFWSASQIARDALVVADRLDSQGKGTDLLEYCVLIASRTIWSLTKKDFDSEVPWQLARASNDSGHCIRYLTKLFGPDHEYTKFAIDRQHMIDDRIKYQKRAKPSPRQSVGSEKRLSDSDKPHRAQSPHNVSVGSDVDLPDRGRKPTRDDGAGGDSRGGSDLLPVPGNDQTFRTKSTDDRLRGNNNKSPVNATSDLKRPRATSESGVFKDRGECFDGSTSKGLAVEPFGWAPPYKAMGERSISALKKTHQFLMDARSGNYPKGKAKATRRVRIAVLDTGVDMARLLKKKKRIQCQRCTLPGMEDQGDQDQSGHGTRIIQLLLDIAPEADIYSYRVFKNTKEVSSLIGIAPAIEQAIADEVDIINMSFGFQYLPINIRNELKKAIARDILIFAAASNSGAQPNLPVAWPAKEQEVFAVFVTDEEGKPWEHNPPAVDMKPKFATLGKNIKSASAASGESPVDGTSYATPIVAGTAALFIDFARLESDDKHAEFAYADAIHHYNSIKALLLASSYPTDNGLSYVKPWHLFLSKNWDRNKIAYKFEDVLQEEHGY